MNTYHVKFQSQSFKIQTEHDQKAFQSLHSEVDKKIKEIQNSNLGLSVDKALFLTCLYLAEDKFLLKQALDKNISQLESQAKSILEDLEISSKKISFD